MNSAITLGTTRIVRLLDGGRRVEDCGEYPHATAVSHVAKLRERYPHHNYAWISGGAA